MKICTVADVVPEIRDQPWRRVVMTNGVFDLIHAGHVSLLTRAKTLGDILVVAINSDRSARGLGKGEGRPWMSSLDRATVLAGMESVDYVVIFDQPTPIEVIREIRPDVLVKGAEYTRAQVVGADMVRGWGGEVVRLPHVHHISTTDLVARIRASTS